LICNMLATCTPLACVEGADIAQILAARLSMKAVADCVAWNNACFCASLRLRVVGTKHII